jgi:hypothetical protein
MPASFSEGVREQKEQQEKTRGKMRGSVGMRTRVGEKHVAVCSGVVWSGAGGGVARPSAASAPWLDRYREGWECAAASLAFPLCPVPTTHLTSPPPSSRSREPLAFALAYALARSVGYLD